MPRWLNKRVAVAAILVAGALLLWWARSAVGLIAGLVLYGTVIGYLVSPLCVFFERFIPGSLSAMVAILVPFGAIICFVVFLFPPFLIQLQSLIDRLPGAMTNARLVLLDFLRMFSPGVESFVMQELGNITQGIVPSLTKITSTAGSFLQTLAYFLITPVLAYYLVRDRKRIFLWFEMAVPFIYRKTAVRCAEEVRNVLRVYLRGQLITSLMTGILTAVGLSVFDIPSSMVLGAQMAVFNLIPYFGPFIGAVPVFLVAVAGGMWQGIIALLVVFVVQQAESMFFAPRIMGATMGVHPVFVMLALLLGGSLFGLAGFIFALPLSLSVRACVKVITARKLSPELEDI